MNNKLKSKTVLFTLGLLALFLATNAYISHATELEKNISAKDAFKLIEKNKGNKNLIVLDIRTKSEFLDGHIKGAINIDYYSPDFKAELNKLDKNKTYLFHCKSGGRSGRAANILKELKFKKLLHLNRGFDEWKTNNLIFEK